MRGLKYYERRKLVETRLQSIGSSTGRFPMRICIFGAGAVGSHFAVRLALAGHEGSCVMRGAHLEAVKTSGLTPRVGSDEFSGKVSASAHPAVLRPPDLVLH